MIATGGRVGKRLACRRDVLQAQGNRSSTLRGSKTWYSARSPGKVALQATYGYKVVAGLTIGATLTWCCNVDAGTLFPRWSLLPVALAEAAPLSRAELDQSFLHRKSAPKLHTQVEAQYACDPPCSVDPDTKMPFPATLSPTSTSTPLQLIGLGVRVVYVHRRFHTCHVLTSGTDAATAPFFESKFTVSALTSRQKP